MTDFVNVRFENDETSTYSDLVGIQYDLDRARAMLLAYRARFGVPSQMTQPNMITILDALGTAAVIAYARCFSKGVRECLCDTDVPEFLREKHERIIHIRSKYAAHSVNEMELNCPVVTIKVVEGVREEIDSINTSGRRKLLHPDDATNLLALIQHVGNVVDRRLEQERLRLLDIARDLGLSHFEGQEPISLEHGPINVGKPRMQRK